MTTFCGRTICNIMTPDGSERIAFFNSMIKETASVLYLDKSGNTILKMPLTGAEATSGFRCLHYVRYDVGNALDLSPRVVPFQTDTTVTTTLSDQNTQVAKVMNPLYEVISPSVLDIEGSKNDTILFWSNCKEILKTDYFGDYDYDADKIMKLDENNLDEVDTESTSIRILCSALLSWESLRTKGALISDAVLRWVPIIVRVKVIGLFTDGMMIDFSSSGGGSGGGIGRHNHSNNNQAGFAYAVAAPGTSLNPVNWH